MTSWSNSPNGASRRRTTKHQTVRQALRILSRHWNDDKKFLITEAVLRMVWDAGFAEGLDNKEGGT